MKKFLKYIAIFAGLCLIMAVAIELLLLTQMNIYTYKRQYVENHINTLKILFLGNSHIEEAVDPKLVGENCFNMAISGRALEYDYEIAKRYVPQMTNLKFLFLPLDYTRFNFGRGVKNPNEKRVSASEIDWNKLYNCMYYKYMGIRIKPFWCWSEIYNSGLNYMMRFVKSDEVNRECDELGYIALPLEKRNPNWKVRNMPALIDTSKPVDTAQFNRLKEMYDTFAKLTQERGAKLILLGTPMYETYQKDLNPAVLQEITNFVADLKSRYDNVEYYDFTFDKRFQDEDFNDASHLSEKGAPKFSKMLREIVEKK